MGRLTAVIVGAFVLTLGCGDDDGPSPACRVLQEYYEDCCYTCGGRGNYCLYNAEQLTERSCNDLLSDIELNYCYCE